MTLPPLQYKTVYIKLLTLNVQKEVAVLRGGVESNPTTNTPSHNFILGRLKCVCTLHKVTICLFLLTHNTYTDYLKL